jgi:single-strand DNA-binding protein
MERRVYKEDFMATGFNRVLLIGNLGKDPEVRQTPSGTTVGTLRLGVTERRKEGDEYKDQTEWVTVVCFGKTAENASKYLQKGKQIFVEGRLQTRKWEDKNTNQTRYTTEVIASQVSFLGSSREQGSSSFSRSDNFMSPVMPDNGADAGHNNFVEDDEIPF